MQLHRWHQHLASSLHRRQIPSQCKAMAVSVSTQSTSMKILKNSLILNLSSTQVRRFRSPMTGMNQVNLYQSTPLSHSAYLKLFALDCHQKKWSMPPIMPRRKCGKKWSRTRCQMTAKTTKGNFGWTLKVSKLWRLGSIET